MIRRTMHRARVRRACGSGAESLSRSARSITSMLRSLLLQASGCCEVDERLYLDVDEPVLRRLLSQGRQRIDHPLIQGGEVESCQGVEDGDFGRRALGRGKPAPSQRMLQVGSRAIQREPLGSHVGSAAQVLHGASPVSTLLEVLRNLGRDFVERLGKTSSSRFRLPTMQHRAPRRRLALVQNLPVERVHE